MSGPAYLETLRALRKDLPTLAERLSEAGYATYGLASNPNIDDPLGFTRGFDRFSNASTLPAEHLLTLLEPWDEELRTEHPFFLYLHLNDVHAPYEKRAPWYRPAPEPADARARYDSEISYLDGQLEAVFERFGWMEDTVVVVVSDHGEAFGEHGATGHEFDLHAEVNNVLMMVRAPELGAGRVDANVSLIDVLPTVLELTGLDAGPGLDGRSLVGLGDPQRRAELEADLRDRALFAHRTSDEQDRDTWAVVRGSLKLIEVDGEPPRLYDLAVDPGELDDLAQTRPEQLEELRGALRAMQARAAAWGGTDDDVQIEMTEELYEELQRLGYTGH